MPSGNHQPGDANAAATQAMWGLGIGAVKWSFFSAAGFCLGYAFSPLFRGLRTPFKVYLFMSPMIVGGLVESESRLRDYETQVRLEQRKERAAAMRNAEYERLRRAALAEDQSKS